MIQRRMLPGCDWLRTAASLMVACVSVLAFLAAGCGGGGGGDNGSNGSNTTTATSGNTTSTGGTTVSEYTPTPSPNGAAVVYGRAKVQNGVEYGSDVWLRNGDGGNPHLLYQTGRDGMYFVWSPGSDRIAFLHVKDERTGVVAVIGIGGDGYRELRQNSESLGRGTPVPEAFSADGQRVQFRQSITEGNNATVTARYTIGIDGTGLTRIE